MKEIPLTQGKVTTIDDDDLALVSRFKWRAFCARADTKYAHWYAVTTITVNGRETTLRLHRLLLNAPKHLQVDHRDGDGLNNQRSNLRLCTHAQNLHNSRIVKARSGFRGVKLVSRRWQASIRKDGAKLHLGTYDTAVEAARVYDRAALELRGEFAGLNFPESRQLEPKRTKP